MTTTHPENVIQVDIVLEASADVTRSDHADECVAVHPGQACPGYPHEEEDAK